MKRKKLWLVPVLLTSTLLMVGADDCSDTSSDSGKNNKEQTAKENSSAKEKPTAEEPSMTAGQENALSSAEDYLSISGFSKAGLIGQLSSSAGDGFSKADATFAANHVDVDWNEQAYRSAKDYLGISGFSKAGLIDQLSSSAGDQYTQAQAEYGANKAYSE